MKPFRKVFAIAVLVALLIATLSACNLFKKDDDNNGGNNNNNGGGSIVQPPQPEQPVDISDATSGLKYKLTGNSYSVVGILDTNTRKEIVIPETYNGLPVDTIGGNAFEGAKTIKSITLSENVTSIGDYAFKGCESLRTIHLNKVNAIGNGAFRGCKSLQFVDVSEDNENFVAVNNVLFNKDMTTLWLYPTAKSEPESYSIPKTVKTIRSYAFEGEDMQLSEVLIDTNVEVVSFNAFYDTSYLHIYYIPVDAESNAVPSGWNENWHNFSAENAKEYIAPFSGKECVITLDTHGGSKEENVLQYERFYISAPESPTREGYRFDGWFFTDTYEIEQKVKFPFKVEKDLTFHAKWVKRCTIKFITGEGGTEIEDVVQDEGHTVAQPADPVRENYRFDGWRLSGVPFDFASIVSQDLNIEAKWVLQCHVVFDLGYGEDVNVYHTTVPKDIGQVLGEDDLKKNPSRLGFKFMGWYTEKDGGGKQFTEDDLILQQLEKVFYAYWKESFTVIFDSTNGNTSNLDVAVLKGESITTAEAPAMPERENYRFDGWFSEQEGAGVEFKAGETVFETETPKKYYAKWVRQYVVTINNNGGQKEKEPYKVDTGSKIEEPETECREKYGYDFNDWRVGGNDGEVWNFETDTVTQDITLFAHYTAKSFLVTFKMENGVVASIGGVEGEKAILCNFDQVLTAAEIAVICPSEEYRFIKWYYGGTEVGEYEYDETDTEQKYPRFVGLKIDNLDFGSQNIEARMQRQYKVSLVYHDESETEVLFVDENDTVAVASFGGTLGGKVWQGTPIRHGYVFDEWLNDSGVKVQYISGNRDYTLTAKWHLDKFNITYRIDGADYAVNEIEYLTEIFNFIDPVIDGFVVREWLHEDGSSVVMPYTVLDDEVIVASLAEVVEDESYFDFIELTEGSETKYAVALKEEVKNNPEVIAIKIPNTHNGKNVIRIINDFSNGIKYNGFVGARYLQKVEFNEKMGEIDTGAFEGCAGLKVVYITKNISSIGEVSGKMNNVFRGCNRITQFVVDEENVIFRNNEGDGLLYEIETDSEGSENYVLVAYPAGRSDKVVELANWVVEIRNYALDGASKVETIRHSSGGEFTLGKFAFVGLSGLSAIEFENNTYTSDDGVLYSWDMATLIAYPQNKAGQTFTVGSDVTKIEVGAFRENRNLTEIVIGKDVTTIGNGKDFSEVFGGARSLASLTIDAENSRFSSANGVLLNKSGTTLLFYPSAKADKLYNVPQNITAIEMKAFYGALYLEDIYIKRSVVTVGKNVFENTAKLATVYIEYASESELPRGVDGWNHEWNNGMPANATIRYGS